MRWQAGRSINQERNQPPDGAFTVGVGADQFGHAAHRRRLGLDLPALGGQRGAFGPAARLPASRFRASTNASCAGMKVEAVIVGTLLRSGDSGSKALSESLIGAWPHRYRTKSRFPD
jgi:hypothetical protein